MALYSYEAFSKDGKRVQGVIDAPSADALKEQLTKQGLFPIKIEPTGGVSTAGFFKRLFEKKITKFFLLSNLPFFLNQVCRFCKQLNCLLSSLKAA